MLAQLGISQVLCAVCTIAVTSRHVCMVNSSDDMQEPPCYRLIASQPDMFLGFMPLYAVLFDCLAAGLNSSHMKSYNYCCIVRKSRRTLMFYIIYGDTPHAHSIMSRAFWPGQHMICAADAAIPLQACTDQ